MNLELEASALLTNTLEKGVNMVTISIALNKSTKLLRKNNNLSPRLDAEVLLAHLLNVDRSYLIIESDRQLKEETISIFEEWIVRRLKGEPIAYIIGYQEFMGLNFIVNDTVLIPRPDTEILVEYVIDYCKNNKHTNKTFDLLDIGTGSGAIALSIGRNVPDCELTLIDISEDALDIAKINAKKINISNKTNYLVSDCFTQVKNHKYNIIVSNPPYIPTLEINGLQIEVSTFEPRQALDGGVDGFLFYRRIIQEAKDYLVEGGLIAFEIGYNQAKVVIELLKTNGYDDVHVLKDLSGNDRVAVGNLKIRGKI